MAPRDRIRVIAIGTVLLLGVLGIFVQLEWLPRWVIPLTGDFLIDRLVSVSIWAMFAAVFSAVLAKIMGKLFLEMFF